MKCTKLQVLVFALTIGVIGAVAAAPVTADESAITQAGIYIQDGAYVQDSSIADGVSSGEVGDTSASGVQIIWDEADFHGLYVTGSEYLLSNSIMELTGNGSNDFAGLGSGAMVDGGGTLTLKNVWITTNGCIRPAATSTGYSTLKVYDSVFIANGGELPEDYEPIIGPGMMEPPAPLGITGTSRTTLTMNNSESYYYNSTIIAEGWGALSTDAAMGYVYVEANNCNVQVITSGYGTYADNGCEVVINDSKFTTATYTGIMAGVSFLTLNDIKAVSGGNSVMIHNVMGSTDELATLSINSGKIVTEKAVVLVKSANAEITIDGAKKLVSKSGTLIQSVINDDENATPVNGEQVYGINATLLNMKNLKGDIVHEDTERTMFITLTATTLKGAIKDASVAFNENSRWIATADSNVTLLGDITIAQRNSNSHSKKNHAHQFCPHNPGGNIDACEGVTITAVAGEDCTLTGTYELAGGGTLVVN